MKAIIAGGGTGGHIYPGIAIANEIKEREAGSEILFVGTANGLETKIIPSHGMRLKLIRASGMKGKSLTALVKSVLIIPMGFLQAMYIIFSFRPDIVIGVGGYASGPTVLCAAMLLLPTMILEQNFYPGVTNRILSKVVKRVAINFESSRQFFNKNKVAVTGNPVRKDITKGSREEALRLWGLGDDRFTLFVFGGSQGARKINQSIVEALPHFEKYSDLLQIIHQTGKADFESVKEGYTRSKIKSYVAPYINEMNHAYAVSDLVLCRAGAIALSEIAACGKASILVPFPYASDNHQELNARVLVDGGAALMVSDRELSGETLARAVTGFMTERDKIKEMEKNSIKFSRTDATSKIVNECEKLISGYL